MRRHILVRRDLLTYIYDICSVTPQIKLIMKSGRRYAITTNDAKNAGQRASVRPPLKATEAEKILRTLVAKGTLIVLLMKFHYLALTESSGLSNVSGWLVGLSVKVGSNRLEMYQLSSRARMELLHYLRDQYPSAMDEDFECKICNENVMKVKNSAKVCKARTCLTFDAIFFCSLAFFRDCNAPSMNARCVCMITALVPTLRDNSNHSVRHVKSR